MLSVDEEECISNINIDELYEKNMRIGQQNLSIFNKILGRIHKRIMITSKTKNNEKYIWFIVPKFLFGEKMYDQGDCIAHIIGKLTTNGFHVKYVHPNALFVSWQNWIPSYVRSEYKKKTGIIIDEKGQVINKHEVVEERNNEIDSSVQESNTNKESKNYTPISQYKPSGKLVYNPDMFNAISGSNT
jgi:hypothetical protein